MASDNLSRCSDWLFAVVFCICFLWVCATLLKNTHLVKNSLVKFFTVVFALVTLLFCILFVLYTILYARSF